MRRALAAIVAVAMGTPVGTALGTSAALALDGPGRALVAANTVQIDNNPVVSGTDVTRSFIPPYSGTVRLKWEIRSKDGTPVLSSAGVSNLSDCEKQTSSTDFVTQTCDLRVAGGMPVSVFAFPQQQTNTVFLRNVSLSYRVVNSNGESIRYELPQVE